MFKNLKKKRISIRLSQLAKSESLLFKEYTNLESQWQTIK
jgi:hypothetical protein